MRGFTGHRQLFYHLLFLLEGLSRLLAKRLRALKLVSDAVDHVVRKHHFEGEHFVSLILLLVLQNMARQ